MKSAKNMGDVPQLDTSYHQMKLLLLEMDRVPNCISGTPSCITVFRQLKHSILQGSSLRWKVNDSKQLQKAPKTFQIH